MQHALTIVAVVILAGASFYGIFRFAKWRGMFASTPIVEPPVQPKMPANGPPPATKL